MKKIKSLIMMFLAVMILPFTVFAADGVTLKVNKTDLKIGDQVTVSASIPNDMEAYAVLATLKYDESVFEKIDDSNFLVMEDEMDVTYHEKNHRFGIINKSGKTENELFTVSLKVKENAPSGDTNIALTNISSSDGKTEVKLPTVTTQVSVSGSNKIAMSSNTIKEDETVTVKTTTTKPIVVALSILAAILLVAVGYMYFYHRDKKKTIYSMIALFVLLLAVVLVLSGKNSSKRDVDKNGVEDYTDAKKIIDYIIDIETEEEKETEKEEEAEEEKVETTVKKLASSTKKGNSKYDVNNDGKVDVNDPAKVVEDTTKKNYTGTLADDHSGYYFAKDEKITLKFSAQIKPNEKIKEVYIDGKKYKVSNPGNQYSVLLDGETKAGLHTFTIEKVTLVNGVTIDVKDLTFTVDVLKDKPSTTISMIEEDNVDETKSDQKLKIEFTDQDDALLNSRLVIVKGENAQAEEVYDELFGSAQENEDEELGDGGEPVEIVYDQPLENNNTLLSLEDLGVELGEVYSVFIYGEYDLDSKKNDDNHHYLNELLGYDYSVIFGKVTIEPITDFRNTFPNQGEKVEFIFDTKIEALDRPVTKVVVDGQEVEVTIKDGHYAILLPATNQAGEAVHTITSVVLAGDDKVLCNYEIKYDVLKKKPEIENVMYHGKNKRLSFSLSDKDNATREASIKITNHSTGTVVLEEALDLDKDDFLFDTAKFEAGHIYDVEITGSYDLDSDSTNDKNIHDLSYTHELTIHKIDLKSVTETTNFVKKSSEATIRFKIDLQPQDGAIATEVVINGKTYSGDNLVHHGDGTYSVSVPTPSEAGAMTYNITRITFSDEEVSRELSLPVYVLKDEPVIKDFLIDESKDTPTLSFTLTDEDAALKQNPGKVVVKENDQEESKLDQTVSKGNNNFNLNLETGKIYDVEILLNYDLDNDLDNNENDCDNKVVAKHENVKLYEAKLQVGVDNNLYFEKEEVDAVYVDADIKPQDEEAVQIKSFVMGEGSTPAIYDETGKLSLNIHAGATHGKETFTVNKVILSNDIEVRASLGITIDVLKDVPYINNLNLSEDNKSVSYELVDPDQALKNGTLTILKSGTDESYEEQIEASDTIPYNFEDEQVYDVKVVGSYDLDSVDGGDNAVTNEEMSLQTFMIGGAYNFTLTNASITDVIKKTEVPVVRFTSTNARGALVQSVTINNHEYNAQLVGENTYEVLLTEEGNKGAGKYEVSLDQVKLDTGKTYTKEKDYRVNTLTYTILKDAPTISDIKLSSNKNERSIKATAKIKDDNTSLRDLKVILVDSSGNILDTKEFTMSELSSLGNIDITLSYGKNTDGKYTVKFIANYDLSDGHKFNNQNLGEDTITVENNDIYISDIIFTKGSPYATKGQRNFQVSYVVYAGPSILTPVNDKRYSRLSGVMVNGTHYISEGESTSVPSSYQGRIGMVAPLEAGLHTYTASKVQLELNQYYDKQTSYYNVPSREFTIEVLKDVPTIENLKITEEDYKTGKVTFQFDVKLDDKAKDGDNSFGNGTVTLNGKSRTIDRNTKTVTFEGIKTDELFDLVFKADYDLDTDALNESRGKNENKFENKEFYSVKYGLFNEENYDKIELTDGKSISKKNNQYFEKNENIKLHFNMEGNDEIDPIKVKVNNKEYTLTKVEDGYEFTLGGYKTFGEKVITITDVTLENGKDVKLQKPCVIKPVVLKDVPKITDYKYEDQESKIKVTLDSHDYDGAIIGHAKVKVTDEDGKVVYSGNLKETFEFNHKKEALRYYITVTANYDRDIDVSVNSDNYFGNVTLLEETISFDSNYIELKDINDINLYKSVTENGDTKIELRDRDVTKEELNQNKEKYFVEINMENMPSIRAKITKVEERSNRLILTLDYQYTSKEGDKKNELEIDFGEIKNGKVNNETHPDVAFEALLEKLEANEPVTLNQNYDASSISKEGSAYVETIYTATIDGNGYTIENLDKPLFNELNGTVKDLNIKNVALDRQGHGGLAAKTTKATITNVIVDNVTKSSGVNGDAPSGGLVGYASGGTNISHSAAKNVSFNIGDAQSNGGLVGKLENSTTTDSYATGKISGWWNYNGGFIGNAENSTISGSYAKVVVSGSHACDFVCTYGSASRFTDNISLSSGGGNGFFDKFTSSINNYYLTSSDTTKQGVTNITVESVNNHLFESANFDTKVWRLSEKTSYDNTPIFQTEKITDLKGADNEKFDENKITLYNNLMKLTPFYRADTIIETAEGVTDTNLTTKVISHVLPVDASGNVVTYLTTDDVKKISKLKIVYSDGTKKEYKVNYDNTYDMVANYRIGELKLDYTYNHYVIDSKSQVVNNLTNYLKGLDYTESLDTLTKTADSRIYREFYNEVTSKELKDFVLKYLSNSNFANTDNDSEINVYLEKAVKENNNIEKVLYMYNYFRRFYDLEIDGMKLYDYVLFRMDDFDSSLTANKIADLYLANDDNFNTGKTGTSYQNILSNYTGKDSIAKFIEHLVKSFSNEDLSKWTEEQFKGYLVQIPVKVDGKEYKDIQYTLWDHFINNDIKGYSAANLMLPILTLPEDAAYIISTPVQYVIGAQRSYIDDPKNPRQQALLRKRIAGYANRMATYYDTAYKILGDATLFNNIHTWHHDVRYAYDDNGNRVYQQLGTNEPFHKNFNEVTGYWQTSDGNAAVAWGDRIDWSAEGLLDGNIDPDLVGELGKEIQEYTYHTFTHETAHNIDARLFLRNYGRRFDAGGEDYADSGFMQSFGPNDIVMNLSVNRSYNVSPSDPDWNPSNETGSNYTPDRINSPEKIKSYYSNAFDAIYVMDYLEAKAFLELSSKDKAEIGIRISYPDASTYTDAGNKYRARLRTAFSQENEEYWENLNLKSIDDLIDHKIMKYAGVYKYSTRGSNSYGGEGINTAHWYQPNNPDGRPDSYALKWIAYEMLGYKGYDNGFIEYYSNIHARKSMISNDISKSDAVAGLKTINDYKTDTMAIQQISGGEFDNFDDYKKFRFKQTGDQLKNLNKIVNIKEYTQKLYEALVQDSQWAGWKLEQLLGAYKTDVNGCLGNYWCSRAITGEVRGYPFSTRVRQEIYYKLKHATNDFTQSIFTNEEQTVDFTIDKSKVKDNYEFNANGTLK